MQQVFAVLFCWADARRNGRVAYGPRFALHPAIVRTPDDRTVLDVDLALRADANAVDALCRLALARYRDWASTPLPAMEAERS
jgi:hypothetical protein